MLFTEQVPEQSVFVYHSRVGEGRWTEPAQISLSDSARREEMEAFSAPYDEGVDICIWSLEMGPNGWRNPREPALQVADDPAFYLDISYRGSLYNTNLAGRRVFRVEHDGRWLGSRGRLGTESEATVHELTVAAGELVVMEVVDPSGESPGFRWSDPV